MLSKINFKNSIINNIKGGEIMIEIFKEVTIGGLDYKISNFGNIIGKKVK